HQQAQAAYRGLLRTVYQLGSDTVLNPALIWRSALVLLAFIKERTPRRGREVPSSCRMASTEIDVDDAAVPVTAAETPHLAAEAGGGAGDVPAPIVGLGAGDAVDARVVAHLALDRPAACVGGARFGFAAAIGAARRVIILRVGFVAGHFVPLILAVRRIVAIVGRALAPVLAHGAGN